MKLQDDVSELQQHKPTLEFMKDFAPELKKAVDRLKRMRGEKL